MKKSINISTKLMPLIAVLLLLVIWQCISWLNIIPTFLLPDPISVIQAFFTDGSLLFSNSLVTLTEALTGLVIGIILGLIIAVAMDTFTLLRQAVYPLLVLSQTIPTVAIAPLLILWFGYGMFPKIILITATTFFPIAVGMLEAFQSTDDDLLTLMHSLGASRIQIYRFIKFPNSIDAFFANLKISVTYSLVSAVVAEWVGGFNGLGVYMTRVMKAYSFDKMFAVIFLISILSLLLILLVNWLQALCTPWRRKHA